MNVKPGDMAKITGGEVPAAIGMVLSVKTAAGRIEHMLAPQHGHMWECIAISGGPCFLDYVLPGDACVVPDKWLRRIDPEADDTADQVDTTAEVAA